MSKCVRRFALEDLDAPGSASVLTAPTVLVEALAPMGHVLIQLPQSAANDQLLSTLGLAVPQLPNSAVGSDPTLMWLGPRTWVAINTHADVAGALAARVASGLQFAGGHAVDLSDAHQTILISGSDAKDILAQGCALDIEGTCFPKGSSTRTSIAKMPAILHRTATDSFLLHVDRSVAHQMWEWLGHAVREMAALKSISGTLAR